MCLIITKNAGVKLIPELAKQSIFDNKDGWGVSWVTPSEGMLRTRKGLLEKEYLDFVQTIPLEAAAIIHTRIGTSGKKEVNNCHPFVLSHDIAMAHNGIIKIDRPQQDFSDTWHFAWHVASPMLRRHPELYDTDEFKKLMGKAIGSGSKLAFLRRDGKIVLVNEAQGKWHEGLWMSNEKSMWGAAWPSKHNQDHQRSNVNNYYEGYGHYIGGQGYGAGFVHSGHNSAPRSGRPRWSYDQKRMVFHYEKDWANISAQLEQVDFVRGEYTLANGQKVEAPWMQNWRSKNTSFETVKQTDQDILTANEEQELLKMGLA